MPTPADRRVALAALATLAAATVLLAAGCATPASTPDRLFDAASGQEIRRAELLATLHQADVVLLGELHDNPHHHQRRGALLAELGPRAAVVAEQLPRGARVVPGADLRAQLEAAGFDAAAWGWPLYSGLFGPPMAAGVPLLGGNAARDLARQVARSGPSAWPGDLRSMLEAAPLPAAAQAALDQDLLDGHCGQLPAARVPAMRAAQRLRDASMAQALLDQLAAGARPAVLVAGNGHVRSDHGVPQLLRAVRPSLRVVSVGFGEPGWAAAGAPYTVLWLTPAVARQDPCAGFRMPAPAR
ncbi:MAG: hypothetical protein RJA10_101 [Pseudomonadota bacterium]